MNHRPRVLLLRAVLGFFGFVLALESHLLMPNTESNRPSVTFPSSSYDSSPSWSDGNNNDDHDSGGGWNVGDGGDSSWESSDGSWDSGGDSGSWDSGGGDSGGW